MLLVIKDIQTAVTRLAPGALCLKDGVDSFYECMPILVNYKVNLLIVPPSDLRNILLDIKYEALTSGEHLCLLLKYECFFHCHECLFNCHNINTTCE